MKGAAEEKLSVQWEIFADSTEVLQIDHRGCGEMWDLGSPAIIVDRPVGDSAQCCKVQSASARTIVGGIVEAV